MAHKKGVGSTDNGRDSKSKRLGVKLFGGQKATAGNIIIRQRGTRYHIGENVYLGRDFTIHAAIDGVVSFKKKKDDRTYVSVLPAEMVATTAPKAEKAAKSAAPKPRIVEAPAAPVVEAPAAPVVEEVVAPVAVEAAPEVADIAPAAEEVAAPVAEPAEKKAPAKKGPKMDDLKIVEGVGPKIEQLLVEGGIDTWVALSEAPVERLKEILDAAGPRYQIHNPSTWPAQAKFAAEGKFDELKEYQDMLIGGRNSD
jgi:large subunit ribosomal protein L27